MTRLIIAFFVAIALAGCATTETPPPAWQFAEDPATVKAAIVAVYAQEGYTVESDSAFQIALEKTVSSLTVRHVYAVTGSGPVSVTGNISLVHQSAYGGRYSRPYSGSGPPREYMEELIGRVRGMLATA